MSDCGQCGHDFDAHCLVATTGNDPLKGGIILCPECGECVQTWGPRGVMREDVHRPDEQEIADIRQVIFKEGK